MAKKFSLRQFLVEKAALSAGERFGFLPEHTGKVAFGYMVRKPVGNLVRTATIVPRIAAHIILPKPVAPPVTQSYTGIRGGHPGNIPTGWARIATAGRVATRMAPWIGALAFFATVSPPNREQYRS